MGERMRNASGNVIARDGLRARSNGRWAEDKLTFLDRFLSPALRIARSHFANAVYLDLFAGPGKSVDEDTGQEHLSGALRVLSATHAATTRRDRAFTHAILVNKHLADHRTLDERVNRLAADGDLAIPREHIQLLLADANEFVDVLSQALPTRPYVFAFADMECPNQWPWASVEALRRAVPRGLDLYTLYPDDMALRRMLAFEAEHVAPSERVLTAFYGTSEWRDMWARRRTSADSSAMMRELEQLYMRQLQGLGLHHVRRPRKIYRTGAAGLYSMLFASAKPVAVKLADWEMETVNPQFGLFAS